MICVKFSPLIQKYLIKKYQKLILKKASNANPKRKTIAKRQKQFRCHFHDENFLLIGAKPLLRWWRYGKRDNFKTKFFLYASKDIIDCFLHHFHYLKQYWTEKSAFDDQNYLPNKASSTLFTLENIWAQALLFSSVPLQFIHFTCCDIKKHHAHFKIQKIFVFSNFWNFFLIVSLIEIAIGN
jgi:hypothetical protein